jgi:ABC-type antimicrobial peptide transport system permease subunit
VTGRTGEIGVRIALGAERADIRWLVLREALLLVGSGIAFGLPICYVGLFGEATSPVRRRRFDRE